MRSYHLACDLGAESGRVMLGSFSGDSLALEEIHRFPNTPIHQDNHLFWDIPALFNELKTGLKKAAARRLPISSISTDSWGVDYILLDGEGRVLPPTFHYRDPRTALGVELAHSRVGFETIFAETGIQFMPINTIYQLASEAPERLGQASRLLTIADGFNYLLSGVARAEQSLASTTQIYNPRSKTWSQTLIQRLNFPAGLFPDLVPAGTRLGPLRPEIVRETGMEADVIASCSHDTGAAVAAVPASGQEQDWAYLSSGTWSLMGVECAEPVITNASREFGFTNEIGYGGTVRLLKNIIGLWLVQECRRHWAGRNESLDYENLTRLAAASPAFVSVINPADPRFMGAGDMPAKIAGYCESTGQPAPANPGAFVRCALESLALYYRHTLRQLEQLLGRRIQRLHVVGGGSKNKILNQFVANSLGIPVLAGPAEASAMGNLLIQAIAAGRLDSLSAARAVARHSALVETFAPETAGPWDAAYERLLNLLP